MRAVEFESHLSADILLNGAWKVTRPNQVLLVVLKSIAHPQNKDIHKCGVSSPPTRPPQKVGCETEYPLKMNPASASTNHQLSKKSFLLEKTCAYLK